MHSYRSNSWNSSSGTGSFTVSKPLGVIAGDMLIAIEVADPSTALSAMTLTGGASWNPLASGSVNAVWKVFWKIADASEPATYTSTYSSASGRSAVIFVIAIQNPMGFTPIVTVNTPASGTTFSAPSFDPYTSSDMDIRFMASSSGPWGALNVTRRPNADGFTLINSVQSDKFVSAYYKNLTSMAPSGLATWNTDTAVSAAVGSIQIPAGPFVPTPSFTGWGMPL